MKYRLGLLVILAAFLALGTVAHAQVITDKDPNLQRIDIDEKLRDTIPLDLVFTNEKGESVTLGDYFSDSLPVVITLGYYRCPMLCGLVTNALGKAIAGVDWNPTEKYRVVTVSINPKESFELAAAKKQSYIVDLNKPGLETGWAFLTGDSTHSLALANAVGFRFFYDERNGEYAHPAVAIVVTPGGVISRYLYGLEYPSRDLRLALLEASEGRIGNTLDRLILYCYHYDPNENSYVLFAGTIMKIGGVLTLLLLGTLLVRVWRKDANRIRQRKGGQSLPVTQ